MTRARGFSLQRAAANYLTRWWPNAESTPNGRPGRDVLGTPGVYWEIKTSFAGTSPGAVIRKTAAAAGPDLPVVWYWPPGTGEKRPDLSVVLLPWRDLMRLLVEAEYAPEPDESWPLAHHVSSEHLLAGLGTHAAEMLTRGSSRTPEPEEDQ